MDLYKLFLIGSGGFLGSIARYLTSRTIDGKINSIFPYGTLTVNIIGSFILGLIYSWIARKADGSENLKLILATGFCGGFTTFSAFAYENLNLLEQKMSGISVIYIIVSLIFGVLAVMAGVILGRYIS